MNRMGARGRRWRQLITMSQQDRGEAGPIVYALMVAFVVMLVGAIVVWGTDLANGFMDKLDGFDFDDPRPQP